jgi:hypothetical protein
MCGKVDRENATCAGQIPHAKTSLIRLDAPPTNVKSKPKPGLVLVELVERPKHFLESSRWKAPAVILYLEQDAVNFSVSVQ